VADRQGAADSKNGRCLYSHGSKSFNCSRAGFVCVDEILCADGRTEEQKEDEDKGARSKRKKYVRDAAIGGAFGGELGILILSAIVAILPVVAAGLEEAGDGRREGMDTAREGFREGTDAARGMYRGRRAGRERCNEARENQGDGRAEMG
jgi:hypothetical protein